MKLFRTVLYSTLIFSLVACGRGSKAENTSSGPATVSISSVSQDNLAKLIQEMTGVTPVTVNGQQVSLTDRYSPDSKKNYRAYWTQYFAGIGITVTEMVYTTKHDIGETQGHNVEAVLPGKSKDSLIIIVHYDSIGPVGKETSNPGADDDMSGMALLLETARILKAHQSDLAYTVRFVAADYEEQASPVGLEGARQYAQYISNKSSTEGFKLIGAIDDEQTGWNCKADNACQDDTQGDTFDIWSCSGDAKNYDYTTLGDQFAKLVTDLSSLKVKRGCMANDSDHYAMWEIGVPAVMFTEHNPLLNDHFDKNGGDTFAKMDMTYYGKIAQVGFGMAAQMAGLTPTK